MKQNLKILISLTVAFLVVILYGRLTAGPIKNIFSDLKFNPGSLTQLFTLKFNPVDNDSISGQSNNNNNFFSLPNIDQPTPEETPKDNPIPVPTNSKLVPNPTSKTSNKKVNPTATPRPKVIIPTSKPTLIPKPTVTPVPAPITSDTRPGTSLSEIFKEVNKRACIPVPLLMAFQTKESGPFFNYNNPASVIKIYNTYGWWITGAGNPCFGLGYHTQTGIVPQDSVNAGVRCRNAVGSPTDIKIMGIMQISEWEEQVSRKSTLSSLPKNIDRRVLFDNALIFAYITRARVGNPPKDCNNWPDAMIKTAAEKHLGTCKYDYGNGNTGDYCADILKYYNQYK